MPNESAFTSFLAFRSFYSRCRKEKRAKTLSKHITLISMLCFVIFLPWLVLLISADSFINAKTKKLATNTKFPYSFAGKKENNCADKSFPLIHLNNKSSDERKEKLNYWKFCSSLLQTEGGEEFASINRGRTLLSLLGPPNADRKHEPGPFTNISSLKWEKRDEQGVERINNKQKETNRKNYN